jgi:hypothetical protein
MNWEWRGTGRSHLKTLPQYLRVQTDKDHGKPHGFCPRDSSEDPTEYKGRVSSCLRNTHNQPHLRLIILFDSAPSTAEASNVKI